MNGYDINWYNIDLESNYQKSKNLLENYTFETLILEVYSNFGDKVTKEDVKKHALKVFSNKYNEAREILLYNLENLTNHINQLKQDI